MLEMWPESTFEAELEDCRKILAADDRICLIGAAEGRYIGFIYLAIRSDHVEGATQAPVTYLEAIYVQEAWRKQGIAKLLLAAGERWAMDRGFKELASDAVVDNHMSIAFHKEMGFREVNRIVCFVKNLPKLEA